MISRRQFFQVGGAGLLTLPALRDARADDHLFHIGVIADSHIIDDFYRGPEGNEEDTWTIFQTTKRLTAARTLLNAVTPRLDRVFLVGGYFHDYPSLDLDFYFTNTTRIDHAKALTDGFVMPVHVGWPACCANTPAPCSGSSRATGTAGWTRAPSSACRIW